MNFYPISPETVFIDAAIVGIVFAGTVMFVLALQVLCGERESRRMDAELIEFIKLAQRFDEVYERRRLNEVAGETLNMS